MDQSLIDAAQAAATDWQTHAVAGLCQFLLIAAPLHALGEPGYGPKAEQVRQLLRTLIDTGNLPANTRVPSMD